MTTPIFSVALAFPFYFRHFAFVTIPVSFVALAFPSSTRLFAVRSLFDVTRQSRWLQIILGAVVVAGSVTGARFVVLIWSLSLSSFAAVKVISPCMADW